LAKPIAAFEAFSISVSAFFKCVFLASSSLSGPHNYYTIKSIVFYFTFSLSKSKFFTVSKKFNSLQAFLVVSQSGNVVFFLINATTVFIAFYTAGGGF